MQQTRKWQLIAMTLAVLIAAAACIILGSSRNAAEEQVIAPPAPFGAQNYNVMKTDTFLALVNKAYGNFVISTVANGILTLDMKHANALTRDFFNGNDALLKFDLGDHGFEIRYNPEDQSLKASFKITAQNGVPVPNDVLIKLLDKTTKAGNGNNEQ